MLRVLENLLARQDPAEKHTLLTRAIVTVLLALVAMVLPGFYGVMAAILVYLLGVELLGLSVSWMFLPLALSLLFGLWKARAAVGDYWENYGHG